MSDQKGFNSNAHWWTQIKKPDMLRPYLRIADSLGIPMPLVVKEDYEYDPNTAVTMGLITHAETQHARPRAKNIQSRAITFYKPWNQPCNISRARDVIAEHLAINNLDLQWHIKDCDFLEEKKEYDNKESKTTIYSRSDWDDWWKVPNERQTVWPAAPCTGFASARKRAGDAWHSKTADAMRKRSSNHLASQEQAEIIERLRNATLDTPTDQIADLVNNLSRESPKRIWQDEEDHTASSAYEYIKSLDSDDNLGDGNLSDSEPGHYENADDSDDSRHFDRNRAARSEIDRADELYDNGLRMSATRADRYAAWCKKREAEAIEEAESSLM